VEEDGHTIIPRDSRADRAQLETFKAREGLEWFVSVIMD
jgi:hypothetical protein